ncbi:transposase, MuDR, MULE transposase domain protein [Tanacetum coccineum]
MEMVMYTILPVSGAWVSATNYVNAFGSTVTGCLGDIDNFLKKGKLEQVVVIVKSCSPNALGDLNVTLKDLSGTIPGTIYYKVLDVSSYEKDSTVGAAMILVNVSVFTPKPSKHYLNITKRNVVEVFRKDTLGNGANTSFWEVAWRRESEFRTLFPRMYALESHKKIDVASKLSHTGLDFSFRRAPRGGAEQSQFELLKEKVDGCTLFDMKDRWIWALEGSGEFSVASVRKLIDDFILPEVSSKT